MLLLKYCIKFTGKCLKSILNYNKTTFLQILFLTSVRVFQDCNNRNNKGCLYTFQWGILTFKLFLAFSLLVLAAFKQRKIYVFKILILSVILKYIFAHQYVLIFFTENDYKHVLLFNQVSYNATQNNFFVFFEIPPDHIFL